MNGLGPCARCGANPARGWSQIGDEWYCHPDEGVSCYVDQQLAGAAVDGWEFKLGGTSGPAGEPGTLAHESPDRAQRLATADMGGRESGGLQATDVDAPLLASPPAHTTFSDPGDGYDSAIRWHADFERGTI